MCKPSGGINEPMYGKVGQNIPGSFGPPNTRMDMYNIDNPDELLQQRWYGADCWVVHNRDYNHGYPRPHDHYWTWDTNKGPQRGKEHSAVDNNFC